jgi:hypothetical protein
MHQKSLTRAERTTNEPLMQIQVDFTWKNKLVFKKEKLPEDFGLDKTDILYTILK